MKPDPKSLPFRRSYLAIRESPRIHDLWAQVIISICVYLILLTQAIMTQPLSSVTKHFIFWPLGIIGLAGPIEYFLRRFKGKPLFRSVKPEDNAVNIKLESLGICAVGGYIFCTVAASGDYYTYFSFAFLVGLYLAVAYACVKYVERLISDKRVS